MAAYLVEQLPEELSRVLAVLWSCLCDMKDDLSSSVGAVMDLLGELLQDFLVFLLFTCLRSLGKLVTYDQVIVVIADINLSYV